MPLAVHEIGQYHRSARAEVFIAAGLLHRVVHGEVVGDGELTSDKDLHESVAVIAIHGKSLAVERRIERAVAVEKIEGLAIGSQPGAGHPDCALVAVGGNVQHRSLCQGVRIVGHYPPSVWTVVAMRSERDVDSSIHFQQAGTFCVLARGEDDPPAQTAVTTAWISCRNLRGPPEQLCSGYKIQGMKTLVIVARRVF